MRRHSARGWIMALLAALMVGLCCMSTVAQTFNVVSNFTGASGAYPYGGLIGAGFGWQSLHDPRLPAAVRL